MKTHFLQDQGVQTFHLEDSAQIFLLIASDEASITTDVKPIHCCCVGISMQRMAQLTSTSRTDSDSAKIWICCLKFNDVTWTMRHNNIMNDIVTLVLLVMRYPMQVSTSLCKNILAMFAISLWDTWHVAWLDTARALAAAWQMSSAEIC